MCHLQSRTTAAMGNIDWDVSERMYVGYSFLQEFVRGTPSKDEKF